MVPEVNFLPVKGSTSPTLRLRSSTLVSMVLNSLLPPGLSFCCFNFIRKIWNALKVATLLFSKLLVVVPVASSVMISLSGRGGLEVNVVFGELAGP